MPSLKKHFRTYTFRMSQLQKRKAFVVVVLCMMFLMIMTVFTITNVESVALESASGTTKLERMVSKINLDTYKNILKSELKILPAQPGTEMSVYGTGYEMVYFLSKLFTNIEFNKLQTVLYQEIPGFKVMEAELIGQRASDIYSPPAETPPPDDLFADENIMQGENGKPDDKPDDPSNTGKNPGEAPKKAPILIYHTHNREAFLPELSTNTAANEAYHPTNNITLVGEELAKALEAKGIPTIFSKKDYWPLLPYGEYWRSYEFSRTEINTIVEQNDDIQFMFDLHRDSSARTQTLMTHNGKQYAAVWFIVGQLNPTWQYNYQFASQIEDKLEEKVPGISRGIWAKKTGQYNQDISPHNILIEIGGVDNTLEEAKRTVEVLAEVISEVYWEALEE